MNIHQMALEDVEMLVQSGVSAERAVEEISAEYGLNSEAIYRRMEVKFGTRNLIIDKKFIDNYKSERAEEIYFILNERYEFLYSIYKYRYDNESELDLAIYRSMHEWMLDNLVINDDLRRARALLKERRKKGVV